MLYNISSRGLDLIKSFESLKLKAYLDLGGTPTIGYGTTTINGFPVALGMEINEPVALGLLCGFCQGILKDLPKHTVSNLNQNQVDSLCSFIYNLGMQNFVSSTLLTAINRKLIITEDLFTRWDKARVKGELVSVEGLTERREKEYMLFMTKGDNYVPR